MPRLNLSGMRQPIVCLVAWVKPTSQGLLIAAIHNLMKIAGKAL